MEKMEIQTKQPPEPDSVTVLPNTGGDHISLSSPVGSHLTSPAGSYSSPLHSKHNSGEHISLSPAVSPGISPHRSSPASDRSTVHLSCGSSPENVKVSSPVNGKLPEVEPPAVVVRKDVFKERMDDTVVLEEPMAVVSRAVLEEPKEASAAAAKTDPRPVVGGGGGSERRRSLSVLERAERKKMVRKAALGFRVFGFLFCLVSFSVMAADKNQGWALDSFDRYREFRYCISVNVIGFVYSGAQAFDLSYNLATGKNIVNHQLRYHFDFAIDQVIAYLLISASSSATIRIDDWQANWGQDKFPNMATASVSMSFLAFVALAANSLISGYSLCTSKSV